MSRSIRVSDETWKALRLAAAESGGRLQAIADAAILRGLSAPSRALEVPAVPEPRTLSHEPEAQSQVCRRCGHPESAHSARGCRGVCACSLRRYLA